MRLRVVGTSQKMDRPVEQRISGKLDLGSNYEDGTEVNMNLVLGQFRLGRDDPLPMSIVVSAFLIEEDWFGDLAGLETAIRGYAEATRTVHGTLSSILAMIPAPGFQIGSVIGGIASVVEPGIAEAVLSAADDVFPLTDVTVVIRDRNAAFPPEAQTGTLDFRDDRIGGHYQLSYAWRRIESVPAAPCELI
jgi:hypothetical protein